MALDLASRGWAIGVHYNESAADARSLVETITGDGGTAVALAADFADEAATLALRKKDSACPSSLVSAAVQSVTRRGST